jgi:hypothetical protein
MIIGLSVFHYLIVFFFFHLNLIVKQNLKDTAPAPFKHPFSDQMKLGEQEEERKKGKPVNTFSF